MAEKGKSDKRRPAAMPYVDYRILKLLLDKGYKQGKHLGLTDLCMPTRQMLEFLKEEGATHSLIAGRINSLAFKEYVIPIEMYPKNSGRGYQLTKLGEEAINEYESQERQT